MRESDEERVLAELGEDWVLSKILNSLSRVEGSRLQVGDDAVEIPVKGPVIVSGDMLVSSTDVPPGMTLRQAGSKAIVSVVSDFAAKGAQPLYFIIELGLPKMMRGAEFLELWSGILDAARLYGGEVIAGDTNQANEIIVGVVGVGYSEAPIPRDRARPGDIIAVTGLFGKTATGLHATFNSNFDTRWQPLLDSVYNPKPRLKEGIALGRARLATASIDSSDGLESCLYEISRWSKVSLEVTDPPIDPLAKEYAATYDIDLVEAVFRGGEEYELVLTIPRDRFDEAANLLEKMGSNLIPIGRVTEGKSISVKIYGKTYHLSGRGWRHFR
ncbi:MAG: thiamine-phosphate kinase [Nitrososphaerota archaeon]|nr:thiamine-phosphate kinase [Candidatus Calditenuaceae archaeon]MDW8073007.1 thiamine-phosphate kinase [Nitrososphaerota archaeon]